MGVALLAASCIHHPTPDAGDPVLGLWDLDLARSSFQPGPPVRRQTRTYTQTPSGVRFVLEGVSATGAPMHNEYTAPSDGKDYPLTGVPAVNTVSLRKVTRFRTDATEKKDGRPVYQVTRVVAEDGHTMTVTVKGVNMRGDTVNNVLVFRRP